MARTGRGIYHPTEEEFGEQDADVIEHMTLMAESVDEAIAEAIEEASYDDAEIVAQISNIEAEQTTQNTNIANNTQNIQANTTAIQGLQSKITSSNKLASDLVDDTNQTNKFVTASEKITWGAKYDKPAGGIPKTDLASDVQTSLGKADTAIQDISGKQDLLTAGANIQISNNVVSATDTTYSNATDETAGLMSATDKSKLDGIEAQANKTIVDNTLNSTSENPVQNKVIYASQEVQNTKIETLEADVEDLRNASMKVSGSGSNFKLSNTAKAKFLELLMGGNTEQESYFGTNKLNINYLPISTIETTLNGGSYTFDETSGKLSINASNASGSVTVRSTYNASSNFVLKAGSYYSQVNLNTKKVSNGTGAQYAAGAITIAEDVYITQWYVPTSQGYTKEVYLQINNGSTALPYEKYVGGIPAPNSNYECPIYNVTGNVNNKIQNKNLFNKNTVTNDYWLLTDGTLEVHSGFVTSDYIEVNPSTSYYLTNTRTRRFKYYDTNKNAITNNWDLANAGEQTFTTPATAKYIRLCVDTALISIDTVQLEQGSTATQYVEHQEQNLPFTLASGQKMYQGSYLADNGIHHKRKQVTFSGTTITLLDAKTNGAYVCSKKAAGNLSGQTLTFDEEVTNAIIEYELANEEIIPYNVTQQTQYNAILQVYSYKDETNISSTSDGVGMKIEATAVVDANKIISDINTWLEALESEV